METIEEMLNAAIKNAIPGDIMNDKLREFTDNAIKTMIRRGYIKRCGDMLVLTKKGYLI